MLGQVFALEHLQNKDDALEAVGLVDNLGLCHWPPIYSQSLHVNQFPVNSPILVSETLIAILVDLYQKNHLLTREINN